MSDPAKSPEEIEDVLASIRRLVSDHGAGSGTGTSARRAAHGDSGPKTERAESGPAQAEALILTPSFRVADPDDPWAPVTRASTSSVKTDGLDDDLSAAIADVVAADGALAHPVGTPDVSAPEQAAEERDAEDKGADWQPDDRLARFDVVGGEGQVPAEHPAPLHAGQTDLPSPADDGTDPANDAVAEASDDISDEEMSDLGRLDGTLSDLGMTAPQEGEFESETGDENWPGDGAEAALLTLVARRDPAFGEGGNTVQHAAPEQATAPVNEMTTDQAAGETGMADLPNDPASADAGADLAETEAPADARATDEATDQPTDEATDQSTDQTDDLAAPPPDALGQGPGPGQDQFPPIFSRRAQPATERHAAPDLGPDPVDAEIDDLGADPSPFSFPDPEGGILDEDTLREIIVDVVREELQGVLGQRITRNVRKMVRREIRLALAAEDLE